MKTKFNHWLIPLALLALSTLNPQLSTCFAQGTALTYQGRLNDGGSPANGSYDLTFTLFSVGSGGSAVAGPLTNSATGVTNGLFTTTLDFGSGVFNGSSYWMQIGVRTNGGNTFATLTPRQQVTPTPYAIYSSGAGAATTATTATTANGVSAGSVTGAGIASGQVVKSLNGLADAVTLSAGANVTITPSGNTLTVASTGGGGSGWSLTGNAGTIPGTDFLGTSDNQPLELWVNNTRAFRLEPGAAGGANVVGGSGTSTDSSVNGGTIAGGIANTVSNLYPTVSGGEYNHASANGAVVGGGYNNIASGGFSTISGGVQGSASGIGAFIGGGGYDGTTQSGNLAGGAAATVGGGLANNAGSSYDTVPGGSYNIASGGNSFAAGHQAQALNSGAFVWADATGGAFQSTNNDSFNVRAEGGVRIVTAGAGMTVDGQSVLTGSSSALGSLTPPANVSLVLNMVWIVPGTFIMGDTSSDPDYLSDEGPQTVVTLTNGFWMGQHPVTQGEYQTVMGSNPSYFTGDLSRPVETVTWFNASNFCSTLTQRELSAGRLPVGWVYRLPTEAEWEYCCRALNTSRFYFGNDPGDGNSLTNYAWYSVNSGGTTQPVGQLLPNAWGLVDMAGNVFEWCQDWYGAYPGGSVTNPQGPASGSYRVLRGGSWSNGAANCRSAQRYNFDDPTDADFLIGFRVVLAPGQ